LRGDDQHVHEMGSSPSTQLKGKQVAGYEEAPPPETLRVRPKYLIHAVVPVKASSSQKSLCFPNYASEERLMAHGGCG